jgi:16S rRNA processing protein RimM
MGAAPEVPGYIPVGRVRRPHGIKGDLLVEPLVYRAGRAFRRGSVLLGVPPTGGTVPLHVEWARGVRAAWRVHFEEVGDRNSAEGWRGCYLLASSSDLALDEGEEGPGYAPDELLGMEVRLTGGEWVGTVSAFYELRQGLIIEVARSTAGQALVPLVPEIVKRVDRAARLVEIQDIPGLLD